MSIKKVMNHHFRNFKIDPGFIKEFSDFTKSVYNKNPDHVQYMGSTLLGVYRVTLNSSEVNFLWDSVVNVDRSEVEEDLWKLSSIDKTWLVGGNATNHLLIYLIHLALNSPIKKELVDRFCLDVLILLQFKFVTSWLSYDFPYLANKEISATAYNHLSRRFLIKQVDSWYQYYTVRANTMLDGTNQRKDLKGMVKSYRDDKVIVGVITGISSNLNDMRVEYNRVYYAVKDSGERLTMSSKFGENSDGDRVLLDAVNSPIKYTNYVKSNIIDKSNFIDNTLVNVLLQDTAIFPPTFVTLLEYISDMYGKRKQEYLDEFIDVLMTFGIYQLSLSGAAANDLAEVRRTLKGAVTSRLKDDAELERFKVLGSKLVDNALGKRSDTLTLRNSLLYYVVIWAFLKA